GNLFIADEFNNRIRKVTPAGIISTVAGDGNRGFSGDGGFATAARLNRPQTVLVDSAGNLLIGDSDNYRVRKVDAQGIIATIAGDGNAGLNPDGTNGDGGPATQAALGRASGLALDAIGNLFIAQGTVRKVSPSGIISTVVTASTWGVAIDGGGNLFFSDD